MMNKTQLAELLAAEMSSTKEKAGQFISAFTDIVSEALAEGQEVKLIGFGTFTIQKRAARSGRNPTTGERIPIPPTLTPVFRPSLRLKEHTLKREKGDLAHHQGE